MILVNIRDPRIIKVEVEGEIFFIRIRNKKKTMSGPWELNKLKFLFLLMLLQ